MVKMLVYAIAAAGMLTLVAPRLTATMRTMQAENAALAQLTADTTRAALQSPQAGDRLTVLARRLLALASSETPTQEATQPAARWVPVDDYALAQATPTQQVSP